MTPEQLLSSLRTTVSEALPIPGRGQTSLRHERLMGVGRENLSLARLAEAHWDALAILAEAGRNFVPGAIYGVWASEKSGQPLRLERRNGTLTITGTKMFCSGAGFLDRALVTVSSPERLLLDIDLRKSAGGIDFDDSDWKTDAFLETRTATATFSEVSSCERDIVGKPGWYLSRPGFWHGACGPAACWAGGAAGLVDHALQQSRDDPHTLAHLGAMQASIWATRSYLQTAGREIDDAPDAVPQACIRALTLRHLVEQACTDVLRRLPRAYGPYPLAIDENVSRRYKELDLYVRQSHAERDLEALGRNFREAAK